MKYIVILFLLSSSSLISQISGDSTLISSTSTLFTSPDGDKIEMIEEVFAKESGSTSHYCSWGGGNGGRICCHGGICMIIFTPGTMGQCIVCFGGPCNGAVICGPITGPGPPPDQR